MSKPLTFYTNPMSRGRIARWALEECGADYQSEYLEYGTTMKAKEFLAVNPMGKVPAIKHGDHVVTECAAICTYLADAFPDAGLAPALSDRADYYRWLFFAAGPVEAAVTNNAMGFEAPEEKRAMVGYGSFGEVMDALQAAVANRPYLCGDEFTMADVYLGSQIGWGLQFGSMQERPGFRDYFERITDRDAYRRGNAIDDEIMAASQDS